MRTAAEELGHQDYKFSSKPSTSLMSWITGSRTAAEELGHQDYKFSSKPSTSLMSWITGSRTSADWPKRTHSQVFEPNDYFLTDAFVDFNQESVTEHRFPEDFDYDDITIGETLFNAYRRQVDHPPGEGLSSGLSSSSSSMSHDRTGQPVVNRSHESGYEKQRQNSEKRTD